MMAPFQIYLSFQQFFADCLQIWVLRPANSRAQLVIWGLLNVSLAEQHQNLCDLRAACRRAWGQGIAGKEVHSDCPLLAGLAYALTALPSVNESSEADFETLYPLFSA